MTHDLETLENWLQICLIVAAVCTTVFPLIWLFSPWWRTPVGRLLMLQSVAFAAAIDLTAYFQFWPPSLDHILFIFWTQAIIFGLVAFASVWLTVLMIRMNYFQRKRDRDDAEHS